MPDPILLLVDDDPETLASLASALERRFGADYRVLTERSPTSALARLEQACERGEDVALVVAHLWAPEMTGLDLLARVHDLCPRASRCVLVSYGDGPAYQHVRRAFVLGQLDTYLLKPWGDPEERLYPVVSEILGSWARSVRPRVALLHIVGERWAPRSSRGAIRKSGSTPSSARSSGAGPGAFGHAWRFCTSSASAGRPAVTRCGISSSAARSRTGSTLTTPTRASVCCETSGTRADCRP